MPMRPPAPSSAAVGGVSEAQCAEMCLCRACALSCKCAGECARWRVRACRGRRLMWACGARAVGCPRTRRTRLTPWREPEGTSAAASGNHLTMIFCSREFFLALYSCISYSRVTRQYAVSYVWLLSVAHARRLHMHMLFSSSPVVFVYCNGRTIVLHSTGCTAQTRQTLWQTPSPNTHSHIQTEQVLRHPLVGCVAFTEMSPVRC